VAQESRSDRGAPKERRPSRRRRSAPRIGQLLSLCQGDAHVFIERAPREVPLRGLDGSAPGRTPLLGSDSALPPLAGSAAVRLKHRHWLIPPMPSSQRPHQDQGAARQRQAPGHSDRRSGREAMARNVKPIRSSLHRTTDSHNPSIKSVSLSFFEKRSAAQSGGLSRSSRACKSSCWSSADGFCFVGRQHWIASGGEPAVPLDAACGRAQACDPERRLATGCDDGIARVWRTADRAPNHPEGG
jgi:hypothetical protein